MAVGKEIRTQIASIQSTQKITKAMEMVAASKMRKAKARMEATKPYAQKIRTVINHITKANLEYKHPYLVDRNVKRVGIIVVSTDRGLCGGLNTNLFKRVLNEMSEWQDKGVEVELCLIGTKSEAFFKRLGNIAAKVSGLGDAPKMNDLIGTVKVMLDKFSDGDIDRLYLAENEFINSMTQTPNVSPLIPAIAEFEDDEPKKHFDYIYEPNSEEILNELMMRYIESQVYQATVENVACEMSARMIAMKSATDNAGDLIDELQVIYNKARQAAITQEISEIVAGASAV